METHDTDDGSVGGGPDQDQDQDLDQVRALPLLAGVFLGFVASWIIMFATVLALYSNTSGVSQDALAVVGLLGLPVLSALLLIPRRTRRWGAGFLIGLAIGSIAAAGVCGSFVAANTI